MTLPPMWSPWQSPVVNVYASLGSVLMLGWCWAVNLLVWERLGVDYGAIFNFATPVTPVYSVLTEVSTATALYLASPGTSAPGGIVISWREPRMRRAARQGRRRLGV
jgi:hypothetical protein